MKITLNDKQTPNVQVGDFLIGDDGKVRRIVSITRNEYAMLLEGHSTLAIGRWKSPQEIYNIYIKNSKYIPKDKAHLILGE